MALIIVYLMFLVMLQILHAFPRALMDLFDLSHSGQVSNGIIAFFLRDVIGSQNVLILLCSSSCTRDKFVSKFPRRCQALTKKVDHF